MKVCLMIYYYAPELKSPVSIKCFIHFFSPLIFKINKSEEIKAFWKCFYVEVYFFIIEKFQVPLDRR